MRRSSKIILALIVVLAAVIGCLRVTNQPQPSDTEQIHMVIEDGKAAIERKDVKGIMSKISGDYSDPAGLDYKEFRLRTIHATRIQGKYDIDVEQPVVRVLGDMASVQTTVSVTLKSSGEGIHRVFTGPITLSMVRQDTKRWLVIPTKVWKVTSIDGLPGEFAD